jgi:hypothetical protein
MNMTYPLYNANSRINLILVNCRNYLGHAIEGLMAS